MAALVDAPLDHAARGFPVFPVNARKTPIIDDWPKRATTDPAIITTWWTAYPFALVGTPTGEPSGIVVLDIDAKHGVNGFRTLAALGYAELPHTPTVLTPSGGAHLHFQRPEGGFRNTCGAAGRGIGAGLDWRGDGGYVVLPSPGSGYVWSRDNCPLLPVPQNLLPREAEPASVGRSSNIVWFDPQRSLAGLVRKVVAAQPGERNTLAFWAACRAGELVKAGAFSADWAIDVIATAARQAGLPDREAERTARSGVETGGAG